MTQRLLLIGGGHSHVEVIRRWGLAPLAGVNVTLISPDRHTPYSGMLPGHVAGHYSHAESHIDLLSLCAAAGVNFIMATVTTIDLSSRQAHYTGGLALDYDVASVDTGSTPVLAPIPGAGQHGIAIKPVAQFLQRWQVLHSAALSAPRELHVAVVGTGAAGVEMVLAMQHCIHADGGRARFTLIGNEPAILGLHPPGVRHRFSALLQQRGIALHTGSAVRRAMAGALVLDDDSRIDCDEIVWVTGAAAPAWPRECGLQTDAQGFIAVNPGLQSLSHPQIFAAGDVATMIDTPAPKSGVYAVRQGPVLAENLNRFLRNGALQPYSPQPRALALISAGNRYAVASYGPLSIAGEWIWRWKDRIDRAFMARYRDPVK